MTIKDPTVEADEKQPISESETETTDNQEEKVEEGKTTEEEKNPYKEQMAKLAVENRQKAGALKEAKSEVKKLKDRLEALEENKKDDEEKETEEKKYLSPEEADKLMEEKIKKQRLEDLILKSTSDPDEQKLVRYHLEHSIVRTGDVEQDLSNAIAIANKHLVDQVKKAEVERLEREAINAQYSGGRSYSRPGTPPWQADPVKREANALLKKLGISDGEKYLS